MVAVLMRFHCTHKLQKLCSATLNWFLKSLKKYHNCANPIIHCIICCCSCFIRNKVHANVMLSFQGSFLLMSERSTKLKGGKKLSNWKKCACIYGNLPCAPIGRPILVNTPVRQHICKVRLRRPLGHQLLQL